MEYNLIKINQLDEVTALNNDDYIVADIQENLTSGKYLSRRVKVKNAFSSENIRLTNAGDIDIDLKDPIFDSEVFDETKELLKNDIVNQSDANLIFATAIKALMEKVQTLPNIIMAPGPNPPQREDDPLTGEERLYTEGSIWVDTNTMRSYIYFFDRDSAEEGNITRHWISLTDR